MKIALAQINTIIGDIQGNSQKIIRSIAEGKKQGVDIVVFPELALSGYAPLDLLRYPHFIERIEKELEKIIDACSSLMAIVGLPRRDPLHREKLLYNSAAVISNQKLLGFVDKILLPTYDVFDEARYFEAGFKVNVWPLIGKKIAINICEDLWQHSGLVKEKHYLRDPVEEIKSLAPDILLNLSASPYSFKKYQSRLNVCQKASKTLDCPVILCNQVGGNDSLIFDGHSLYFHPDGFFQIAKGFEEDMLIVDASVVNTQNTPPIHHPIEDLNQALVLGVKDYFKKTGHSKACLGLSGGIDSAVVACIAAEALGPSNVTAVYMPSRYSSIESGRDASLLADHLKIEYKELGIEHPFETFLDLLTPEFHGLPQDATEENLQARIRGIILMAFSNKFGSLLLSTGNKSELAVGYATLYGDMCGGLGVISDLTKEQVYQLARWMNRHTEKIPQNIIDRAPSAELRFDQKDSDSLPEYDVLDKVLQAYIEEHRSPEWIAEHYHFSLDLVNSLIRKIHHNEYKRRQSSPGLRVSEKMFKVGTRFPIAQGWV